MPSDHRTSLPFFRSLRWRLLAAGVGIWVGTIAVLATGTIWMQRAALTDLAVQQLTVVARSRAAHVQTMIGQVVRQLEAMAATSQVRAILDGQRSPDDAAWLRTRIIYPALKIDRLALVSREGLTVLATSAGEQRHAALPASLLTEVSGTLVYDPLPSEDEPLVFEIVVPIRNSSTSTTDGWLRAWVRVESLYAVLLDWNGLGYSGETYIVGQERRLLTPSRYIDHSVGRLRVDTWGTNEAFSSLRDVTGVYPDYRGIPVMGAAVLIPALNWILLAEIDEAEVLMPVRKLTLSILVLGLCATLLGVAVWLVIGKRMLRHLQVLETAATEIAAGSWDVRVPVAGRDEFGVLSAAFNCMADTVSSTMAELLHLAERDPLTGLSNRRHFLTELGHRLVEARSGKTSGAVLYLDLDQFKYVNDTRGHQAGDELLKNLAILLRKHTRENDIISRQGGDEFAILLPGSSASQAQEVAERILEAIRQHLFMPGGAPVNITASIGLVLFPEYGTEAEELLTKADLAMYQAKEVGRNRICTFASSPDQDPRAQMEAKLNWAKRIREALNNDLFILYCQPILDLRSKQIACYELLLRMADAGGEIILPGAFIEVAEQFGLIHAIDRWVVSRAIRLIADQRRTGRDLCLEVNLSGMAFNDNELLPLIRHELDEAGINPASLILEITETAAVSDVGRACEFIANLRELGCQFAIDDFGVGFASFSHLKHLPVDYVKIDGSFVQDLAADPRDQHLVRAMVNVAHGLGKRTIAEFVGDAETIDLLRQLGVDYAQGYHIGRPMPVCELAV